MPLNKKGKKIKNSMVRQYGKTKGTAIFYAMENSGYEIIGEWIFGQDSQDLISFLKFKLDHVYKEIKDEVYEKLNSLLNPVQCEIYKKRFADAIHILAIKK